METSDIPFHQNGIIGRQRLVENFAKMLAGNVLAKVGPASNAICIEIGRSADRIESEPPLANFAYEGVWNDYSIIHFRMEILASVDNSATFKILNRFDGSQLSRSLFLSCNYKRTKVTARISRRNTAIVGDSFSNQKVGSVSPSFNEYSENFDRDVGPQLLARIGAGFPQGPDKQSSPKRADEKSYKGIISGIAGRIRSFPLSAKVGLALLVSIWAAFVLGSGLNRIADGRSYRVSGILRVAAALGIYSVLAGLWAIGGGLILSA